MLKYGILSPKLGIREDYPTVLLPGKYNPDSENCHIQYEEIQRYKLREAEFTLTGTPVQTPDGNPVIHIHRLVVSTTGVEKLLVYTKDNVYYWNNAESSYTAVYSKPAEGASADRWESVTYADKVISTNWEDKVQIWDGTDDVGAFEPLDTASGIKYADAQYLTKAKHITVFENYLVLGFTEENGTTYPQRIRWSDLGDHTTWDSGDAGAAQVGGADFITGFGQFHSWLFIFKEQSYHKIWLVASSGVFTMTEVSAKIGCQAPGSIINHSNGELFFYASDKTIRDIRGNSYSDEIDRTLKDIEPSNIKYIKAAYMDKLDELWWSFAYGASATENNKIAALRAKSVNDRKWSFIGINISAFGEYEQQETSTWADLSYSGWDGWGWDEWRSVEANAGFLRKLVGSDTGYVYTIGSSTTDIESSYTGYFTVETDLTGKQRLATYKRLLYIQVYLKNTYTGNMTIYIKRDAEPTWQTAGTISMDGGAGIDTIVQELPVDYRAKSFRVKFEADSHFAFIGVVFKFNTAGER